MKPPPLQEQAEAELPPSSSQYVDQDSLELVQPQKGRAAVGSPWGQQLLAPGPLDAGVGRNAVGQGCWSQVGLAAGRY